MWKQKVVLSAMALDMFGVLLGGATAMMPIYAKDILNVGPRGLGWLMSGAFDWSFQHGNVAGASRPASARPDEHCCWRLQDSAPSRSFSAFPEISGCRWLMLYMLGSCDNISVVVRSTLVQVLTPDNVRGRVSALNSLFIGTSNELGAFESGLVANFFGPVFSVVSGGIGHADDCARHGVAVSGTAPYGRLDEPSSRL